jgi:hypothetical protein
MERCWGQAIMVCLDHVNPWWGVELLIPLLKHTNEFCVCVKIPCVTDANTWEVQSKGSLTTTGLFPDIPSICSTVCATKLVTTPCTESLPKRLFIPQETRQATNFSQASRS